MEPHLVCAVADVAGWLPNVPIPLLFLIEQGFDGIQSDSLLSYNSVFPWPLVRLRQPVRIKPLVFRWGFEEVLLKVSTQAVEAFSLPRSSFPGTHV